MTDERKISLLNVFGKAGAVTATAAGGVVYFELAKLLIAVTDTAPTVEVNPADHVAPGLIALGVCLATGLGSTYMGHVKRRMIDEFNYRVKLELETMGLELVEDAPSQTRHETPRYRRIDTARYTPISAPRHNTFWEGFWLASWMNSSSGGGGYSSGSSRSRSSSSHRGDGKGLAYLIAIGVMAAAAAASAYVSYKALKTNFGGAPDLLTKPDSDFFADEPILLESEPEVAVAMPAPAPAKARL